MSMAWVWVLIPIAAIFAGVASTWIRVRHGYPASRFGELHRGGHGKWHMPEPDMAATSAVKEALAAAENKIANLEERVRVLERIATDRSAGLRDEIDGLR
jgi:hypothetical protein